MRSARDEPISEAEEELLGLLRELRRELCARSGRGTNLLTVDEVADRLKISRRTLEKEIAAGRLRPLWIRSQRRFSEEMIERYLESYCQRPDS